MAPLVATDRPSLVWLDDPRAADPAVAGAKAATLARAAYRNLPVLDGFVLTTTWSDPDAPTPPDPSEAWDLLSRGGARSLVVRSSSVAEDGAAQSMAGLFTSVIDVQGWQAFRRAVDEVLASSTDTGMVDAPMAVLVQPFVASEWGGVLFSADPISGRTDRMVVTAVRGGADTVVGGDEAGWTASITRSGRVDEVRSRDGAEPPATLRRQLARLARQAEQVFGGPQDIEWAVAADGRVRLLQARPITTLHGPVSGPIFGTGPIAETFPDPLRPLEQDLWLTPLAGGLRMALELTSAAPAAKIRRSPVAVAVDGAPVVDLELLGVATRPRSFVRRFDPRPPARRLRAAWRVGRLTAALPALARDASERIDRDLADVPSLDELSNRSLLAVLDNARQALSSLHGYEALAGMLSGDSHGAPTAASMALSALAQARADGIDSDELVEHLPVVLALLPPRIGPSPALPVPEGSDDHETGGEYDELAIAREALRLRSRWVQELTARAAWELGRRLEAVGILASQESVVMLRLDELRRAFELRSVPADLDERWVDRAISLPNEFRLAADGTPVAVARPTSGDAVGAGGGVGRGSVYVGDDPPTGAVLVVRHLDPRLAPLVSRLAGLVAETGSPLSHLAILAREHGVPTVVGYPEATTRLTPGAVVEVDGATGAVTRVDDESRGFEASVMAESEEEVAAGIGGGS
ncbi:MAG: PEP/pyruvate-binding domain-containing protein [Acidimicrobiales bacterium]